MAWVIPPGTMITNASAYTIGSTSSTLTWNSWNTAYEGTGGLFLNSSSMTLTNLQWQYFNTAYEETAEQRQAREAEGERLRILNEQHAADARARAATVYEERKAANELAENLLMACLSQEQAADHVERGWIDVTGSRGHLFRILTRAPGKPLGSGQQAGNVLLMEVGKKVAEYCVHPPDGLPHADAWLAQKLALEADEDMVLAVANMPWYTRTHRDIRPAAKERHLQLVRQAA